MCVQKRENRKLRDRKLGGSQPSVVKPAQMTRVLTGSQRITAARVIGCRHYRILVCSYTLPSATNRHPCSTSLRDEHAVKHCRRVATRYDKLAANYLAFVQLASISMWLRALVSTRPPPFSSLICANRRSRSARLDTSPCTSAALFLDLFDRRL